MHNFKSAKAAQGQYRPENSHVPGSLHVALVGPATLSEMQKYFSKPIESAGYPFPLIPTLVDAFLSTGIRVTVVTTGKDITRPLHYKEGTVQLFVVPSSKRGVVRGLTFFAKERKGIAASLKSARPDIIHSHWMYEFTLGALDSKCAPVLATTHDAPLTVWKYYRNVYRGLRAVMAFAAARRVSRLTAVSPYLAEAFRKQMLYSAPIDVIPNPMVVPKGFKKKSTELIQVLTLGDSSKLKNVKTLLWSFRPIRVKFDNVTLRLAGPGLSVDGEMAAWANENGLVDGVAFLGMLSRDEVAEELSSSQLFCHPSLEESQGVALLEAMSYKIPIVAGKNSGAVPWTMFEGKAGDLCDVSSIQDLTSALESCIIKINSGQTVSTVTESELIERFGLETVMGKYLQVYEEMLGPGVR